MATPQIIKPDLLPWRENNAKYLSPGGEGTRRFKDSALGRVRQGQRERKLGLRWPPIWPVKKEGCSTSMKQSGWVGCPCILVMMHVILCP